MKNTLYILAVATLCACSNAPKKAENTIIATPTGLQGIQSATNQQAEAVNNTAKSDLLFNPAHGQPGHDCALAVGAPLNKSTAPASQTVKANPVTTPTVQTVSSNPVIATPVKSAKTTGNEKLNPAHGMPGHDCAVAVGAPLSSKNKNQTVTAAPQQQVVQPQTTQPTQSSEAKSSGKLNPAHGEPGHDCAKPVGSPLS